MNDEAQFKELVVDAIVGIGFPSFVLGNECERVGLAKLISSSYTGQHYEWIRSRLEAVALDKLQELYEGLREAREELAEAQRQQPQDEPSLIVLN